MLLSDDRDLPMPLQKTQNINNQFRAFGRDWPNRSSAYARRSARLPPAQFFCARKDPRVHQPLTFLSQQSFGYCPRAKRSRSNTHAGVVGYLFETAHHAIAPMWQPGAYIRSCELSGVVERAHSNVARKTKGWVEHKIRHAVGNSRGIIAVPAARAVTRMLDTKLCRFPHYFEATSWRWREDQSAPALGGLRGRCNEMVFRASTLRAGKNLEPVRTPKRRNKHRQLHFIATS